MQDFTVNRSDDAVDEIWLLEHDPVFTQGQAGKAEHLLSPGDIPVVPVDRGGQVTYHGPGQLVAYVLLDMKRIGSDVRKLVTALEDSVIQTLAEYDIEASAKRMHPAFTCRAIKSARSGFASRKEKAFTDWL